MFLLYKLFTVLVCYCRSQEVSLNFGSGEDALAALNPIQKSNGRDLSPAPPFPSIEGNPFG